MVRYIKQNKFLLFLEILTATSRAVVSVLLSFAMGQMTNAAVDRQVGTLLWASGVCVASLAVLYVLHILEMHFRKLLSGHCICEIKADLYTSLTRQGIADFHKNPDSYYLNLLQGDIDLLERDYFDALWRAINLSIQTVFCVVALMYVSIKLFVIFALVSVVPQITSRLFSNMLTRTKNDFSEQSTRCIQKGKEFISGFDTILFFSKQQTFLSRLLQEDKMLEECRRKRDVCNVKVSFGATTISMVAQIICMAAAAYFVAIGELRFGALTTSTQLLNYVFTPLNTVINCVLAIVSTKGIRGKFLDWIQKPAYPGKSEFHNGDICFNNVTAGYGERDILKDFSYRMRQGGTYAVIGSSGAGKSTLARVLMGIADMRSGSITIGGVDIRDMSWETLYRNVLYVPQNTFLFEGTVLENISFFSESTEAWENALRAALPAHLLGSQAGGDRGAALSGGEKNRLAIARALCSSAPVIVFDEPTSGLDPNTAAQIEDMIQHIPGKTIFVITHNWDSQYLNRFDGVVEIGKCEAL